jgi:hypothetical protein
MRIPIGKPEFVVRSLEIVYLRTPPSPLPTKTRTILLITGMKI